VATDRGEAPQPKRSSVRLDKLKPPPRHRKQPPENPAEAMFNATKGRNERRTLREKYAKKYQGKHRKGK